MAEPTPVSNHVLRRVGDALAQIRDQPKPTLAAHRLKAAQKELAPKLDALGETIRDVVTKYGKDTGRGSVQVPREHIDAVNAELGPVLKETVEIPKLKGITYADLADAKISEDALDALEAIGLLTGSPEPEEESATKPEGMSNAA